MKSNKSFTITILLCFFGGVFGLHRFYVGKILTGILLLISGGGFGVWWIIDLIQLIRGKFEDGDGKVIKN